MSPSTPVPDPATTPATPPPLNSARPARWRGLARDAALVVAIFVAAGLWQTRGHLDRGTAPEVTLPALDGPPVSLASLRGKPAMVVFWAPWCGVCKVERWNVSTAAHLAGGRASVVSVVASYEDAAQVRRSVAEQSIDYPVLLGDDATLRAFRVEAFPTVYFLDAEGRVKGSVSGYTTTAGLLARLLW